MNLEEEPRADDYAHAISCFLRREGVSVLLLDGPQGWKDPESDLEYRYCEKILNAQAKTGIANQVKPKNFTRFVEFSISLFEHLTTLCGTLVECSTPAVPPDGFLLVESYPRSAWCKLDLPPLPGKKKAKPADVKRGVDALEQLNSLRISQPPTHDELSALVAGLAGVAILGGNTSGYIAQGTPPKKVAGVILEGFIVNPCLAKKAA
ncbi:MAG: DUF429 domain-containing protein [Acidobacteriia bacterium]|nr:DUF429 domain-containing protein [Terriglobia bacterium]